MKFSSPGNVIRAFATMRMGLTLLAIIIVLSAVGTLIPQESDISAAGPVLHFFYHTLGFGNLYHSWWFGSLLFFLCLNVAYCSLSRLPVLWRDTFSPPVWPAAMSWQRECRLALPPDEAAQRMRQRLKQSGFRVWDIGTDRLYARKGQLAPWGTFLIHASILIIALGSFYGSMAGFQYSVLLAPGDSVTIGAGPYPAPGRPFELRLNTFTTELYPNGQVSDWISNFTVTRDGEDALSQDVKVNHPFSYQGVSFYQASYSNLYEITQQAAGHNARKLRLEEKQPIILDDRLGIAVVPLKYLPDFDPKHPMVSQSAQPLNPHVIYMAYSGGRPLGMNAVAIGNPLSIPGSPIELVFNVVQEASGLDVKHDPGLPLVFTGFSIMGAAFFLSLLSHRRVIWAEIRPNGESTLLVVTISGRSQLLTEELSRLCQNLAN